MGALNPLSVEVESSEFKLAGARVVGLRGREEISQLFWFEVELVLPEGAVLPNEAAPGAAVTLRMSRGAVGDDAGEERHVYGIIEWIRDRLDTSRKHRTYVLRVVPELARLLLVETQEVFIDTNVPEIIRKKLDLHELAGPRLGMHTDACPKRELVVQYRESDLAFLSRISEHMGISYVFEHGEQGPERVIFTDDVRTSGQTTTVDQLPFRASGEHEGVFSLELERRLIPTTFATQDYNYRRPLADIDGLHELSVNGEPIGNGGGIVEYGSNQKSKDEGNNLAKIRAEERLSQHTVFTGRSAIVGLTAGACPTLVGHPTLEDQQLIIVAVEHYGAFGVGGPADKANTYENTFKAIPAEVRFRPPRVTPRPRIHGLATGTVALGSAGTIGGKAQIDGEGRYLVQIHFDTVTHTGEDKPSHRIRMSQPFAGPNHGFHFPLRPGAEVVLAFVDGDPDRPIIVGSVPNATAPSASTSKNSHQNRIQSATGIVLQFSENK